MIETIVSVEESKLEQAWQLACEYDQAVSRQQNKTNIISRMVGNRRIDSLGRKLCANAHIDYQSDDEQEQLEIMTGESELLYVPGEDRWIVAGIIARNILSAEVIVTADAIIW